MEPGKNKWTRTRGATDTQKFVCVNLIFRLFNLGCLTCAIFTQETADLPFKKGYHYD
ncbi:hypothetical protein THMIRHAS_10540 [Thiosulfatimonas sediminis]|uniref:Uncharacterized protein n=1 Tax=Thiosulfatimonas sediminis TaxID=2675054 RepID=A0A6F8PU73_9GAMM|nr:hypothetical protein THMIRHAS_10540 [Thiosulfatimonas sediminis]